MVAVLIISGNFHVKVIKLKTDQFVLPLRSVNVLPQS